MNRSTKEHLQAHIDRAAQVLDELPEDDEAGPTASALLSSWFRVLRENWKLLLLGTLVAPVAAAAFLLSQPKTFVADALIVPSRTRTQVQFEPTIKTSSDTDPSQTQANQQTITPERRQALVDLVSSGELEGQVIPQLQGIVDPALLQSGRLGGHVKGVLMPKSEIIAIEAESNSPADAIAIANAWATSYIDLADRIYAGADSGGSLTALMAERDRAAADASAAQAALVSEMKDSRLEQDQREIADKEHELALWQSAYQAGAFTASTTKPVESSTGGTPSPSQQISASPLNTVDVEMARNDYRLAQVRTLNDLAQTIRRLDTTKQSLQALLNKVEANGPATGDVAAVTLLKTQLVAMSDGLPGQLQFQVPSTASTDTAADLRQLESSIDQARAQTQAAFDQKRATYEADRAIQVQQLQDELRSLRSEVEALTAQRNDVTLKRDLARSSYSALARKVEERRIAEATMGSEVEIAGKATIAVPPPNSRLVITAALAAVVGLVISMLIVILRHASSAAGESRGIFRSGEAVSSAG